MKKTASIISLLVALALIAGCGNPISQSILDLNKDETGPVITITSPAEGSAYAKTVGVTGTVTDAVSTGDEANSGALASLTYQVAAAGIQTTAVEVADGAFSFQFSAASLTGTIVVTIVATDQNGNDSVKNLTLIDAGNDIPSFTAIPGNRSVTLQWGVVPGAQDYTIYYTTNNTSPSEYYYHGQILPAETAGGLNEETGIYSYTLSTHNGSSLKNGSMHGFLLKASGTVGEETLDNYSAVEQAIPLSGTTLCPLVRGGAGCVVLEWNVLEGTDSFNVYRRESGSDEAIRIAYNYEGNSFSDDNAEADTWYFYSVAPAMDNGVVSSENTGTMVPVDDCPLESILLDTQGEGKEVVVSGNYAYVAEGYTDDGGMLSIYNIGNTNRIRLVGSLLVEAENSRVEDIVISGEYAYLAVDEFGLVIVDISNPASPQVAGTCEDPDIYSSYSIDLDGNYVYLGGSNSIARVDVSNPSTLSATVEIASASLYDVAVSGNYVIGMYQYGSTIYVHNKSTLAEVDTADTSVDIGAAYMPYSVACYGGRLYVGLRDSNLGNPAGMCIYNINPGTGELTLLEDIDGSGDDMLDTPAKVEDICIHDDMCYVTYENGTSGLTSTVKGLIAWDITDPATPVEKMSMDLDGTPLSIFRTEAILAVCGYQGLKVFDFSNNLTPSEEVLTYPNLVSVAGDIIRRGDYTYMVDMVVSMPDEYALKVFSQPGTSAPTLSTSLPLEYGPRHMAVNGESLYLVCSTEGLFTYDISDPGSPSLVSTFPTTQDGKYLQVRGDYIFMAQESSIQIINTEDPETLATVDTVWLEGDPECLLLAGDFLYATIIDTTVIVKLDVSDPENVTRLTDIDIYDETSDADAKVQYLSADNGYLYVSLAPGSGPWYFAVVKISSSGSDEIITALGGSENRTCGDIEGVGDFLFLSNSTEPTIAMFNIADKENPFYEATFSDGDCDFSIWGRYVYQHLNAVDEEVNRYDLLGD